MKPRLAPSAWLVGASLLVALLAGCSDADRPSSAPSTPPPSVPGATPLDPAADGTELLDPGTYSLTANGAPGTPLAVVTVPDGLFDYGGFGVGIFPDSPGEEPYRTLTYWTIDGVFEDPCGKGQGTTDAGTTVADLVEAFRAQRLMRMTAPQPVTIDGYAGQQFDLTAPADVLFEDCDEDLFVLWANDAGGGRLLQEPGQLVRMRVLDVDGHRVVLSTSVVPGQGDAGFAALDALATTVRFAPGS